VENLEPQPASFDTRELFDTDSDAEEGPPPLVDESDSNEDENQEAAVLLLHPLRLHREGSASSDESFILRISVDSHF
jgi:hypothetical protein